MESIRRWWHRRGRTNHPNTSWLLITANVQDQAPAVLPHHRKLARTTADQLPGGLRDHRRNDHRAFDRRRTRHRPLFLDAAVTPAEFQALPIAPNNFHGDWTYTLAPARPKSPEPSPTRRRIDPALTSLLTDPALTGRAPTSTARWQS